MRLDLNRVRLTTSSVALAFLFIAGSGAVAQPVADPPLFPGLTAADVGGMTLEGPRYTVTLQRIDGVWIAVDHGGYPVKPAPADAALTALRGLLAHSLVTEEPARYGLLDVEGPGAGTEDIHAIIADTAGTVLVDAIIGAPAAITDPPPRSGIHVRNSGEAGVWLAQGGFGMPARLSGWFDPLLQIPGPEVASITVFEGDTLVLQADKVDFATGTYGLTALNEEIAPLDRAFLDPDGIRSLTQAVVSITAEDVVARDSIPVPEEARSIRFATRSGLSILLTLLNVGEDLWFAIDATGDGAEAVAAAEAIQARTSAWAFRLPEFNTMTLGRNILELVFITAEF